MADQHHEHGTMDTSEQQKTFEGFITVSTRCTIAVIVVLILLAMFRT